MIHLGGSNHDARENLQECQIVNHFQNWLREIFPKLSGNDSHEVGEMFSIFSISFKNIIMIEAFLLVLYKYLWILYPILFFSIWAVFAM